MQVIAQSVRKARVLALAAALAAAGMAGCDTTVPRAHFPELAYDHLAPMSLAVGQVEVVQEYRPPAAPPNVEHLFPIPPAETAERWVRDRVKAVGGPGQVRAVIVTASVVEVPLERRGGIRGAFTTEQSERYDAELEVRLDLESGGATASVSSRAERRRTVPENISLADREKVWFEMTEAMMNDINASLERQIRENFGPWLR
jgi:hypothetical protein